MPGNFLSDALRNLVRHKLQTLVNITSLALGLAVFAFAFLYVKQQLSYNRGWPDAERIHRLTIEQHDLPGTSDGAYTSVKARAWPRITEHFADDFEAATRVLPAFIRAKESSSQFVTSLHFADPAFSTVFPLDIIAGDLDRVLSGPGFVALEEAYAATLGPDIAPGARITLVGLYDDELEFEVAALYRLEPNRSNALDFNMLSLIHDYALPLFGPQRQYQSWEDSVQIWLKLKPGIPTEDFNARQPAFVQNAVTDFDAALGPDRRISEHLFYRWQPVPDLHFNPVGREAGILAGDPARVATFAAVGLLVLLVGCSNSVSLSLASAIERRKEIGIRKAAGALRQDILLSSLGESVLLALLALIAAITLLEMLLPAFQTLMPFTVVLTTGWVEYSLLTLIALLVGLASGIYPALVLSAVRPQAVLKSGAGAAARAGHGVRALLVGAQFWFASMLLIGTAALYLQLAITRAQPLGFNPANLAYVFFRNDTQGTGVEASGQELRKIPGVVQVAGALNMPNANMSLTANNVSLINKSGGGEEIKAQMHAVALDFFDVLQIPLLGGRNYDFARDYLDPQAQQAEGPPRERNLIVNRTTTRILGFASPDAAVGQLIHQRATGQNGQVTEMPTRIIGVVEDNMYGSLHRRPGPEIYPLVQQTGGAAFMVKYVPAAAGTLQDRIDDVAERVTGAPAQSVMFVEERIELAFWQEQNESKLLLVSGTLALLLASIGLYGLAAFSMERRIKEVGVRKVLGASVGTIVTLFLWRFARPVLAANVLAWPVALYFVLQWIERFPYQIDKAWLLPLCLAATAVVLSIALLTVSLITLKAARTQPVRSLRYE